MATNPEAEKVKEEVAKEFNVEKEKVDVAESLLAHEIAKDVCEKVKSEKCYRVVYNILKGIEAELTELTPEEVKALKQAVDELLGELEIKEFEPPKETKVENQQ